MDRERAIEKVRKLRALAERPGTEHEGKAAKASAARLMLRHGLSEANVAPLPQPQRPPIPQPQPAWSPWFTVTTNGAVFTATGNVYVNIRVG